MKTLVLRSKIKSSAEELFAWHLKEGALERSIPPWERVEILEKSSPAEIGSTVACRIHLGPFAMKMVVQHEEFTAGREFCDVQTKGPFKSWKHRHRVIPVDSFSSILEDTIDFKTVLPLFDSSIIKQLNAHLKWKHEVLGCDLEFFQRYSTQKLRILVSGSSGLIGRFLTVFLKTAGHEVIRLVRSKQLIQQD
ncbi:MAG: TIGR01777 family protein, partial [Anaerolineae bacterium]